MIPFGEVQEGRRFKSPNLYHFIKLDEEYAAFVNDDGRWRTIKYGKDEMVTLIDTCLQCEHFNSALNIEGQKCNKLSLFFGHGGEHGSGFLQNPATFHCSEFAKVVDDAPTMKGFVNQTLKVIAKELESDADDNFDTAIDYDYAESPDCLWTKVGEWIKYVDGTQLKCPRLDDPKHIEKEKLLQKAVKSFDGSKPFGAYCRELEDDKIYWYEDLEGLKYWYCETDMSIVEETHAAFSQGIEYSEVSACKIGKNVYSYCDTTELRLCEEHAREQEQ